MIFIDKDRCTGCGYCALKCPQMTLSLLNGTSYQLHPGHCINCGICEISCYYEVIIVVGDDAANDTGISDHLLALQSRNPILPC